MAVAIMAGLAHDGDDLINGRRVGRVTLAFIAWRDPGAEPGRGRRRPAPVGSIQQRLNRHGSLLCESWTITRPALQPTRCRTTETSRELRAMRVARCDSARDGRPVSGRGAGKRSVASGLVQLGALRATGVAP